MPYEVLVDGATVLKSIGESQAPDGTVVYDNVSTVYPAGAIIADEDVSPVVKKAYEDGDEHVLSLLKETGDEPTHPSSEQAVLTDEQTDHDPGNVDARMAEVRSAASAQMAGEIPETAGAAPVAEAAPAAAAEAETEAAPKKATAKK